MLFGVLTGCQMGTKCASLCKAGLRYLSVGYAGLCGKKHDWDVACLITILWGPGGNYLVNAITIYFLHVTLKLLR